MASVSASHLVLFITSIVVAAGVGTTVVTQVDTVSHAFQDRGDEVSDHLRTDIEVISTSTCQVYDRDSNNNLTLLVENAGERTLPTDADEFDVFIDGEYKDAVSVTPLDNSDWPRDGVVELEIDAPDLSSDDHRVKVVVEGDEAFFSFNNEGSTACE